jgi:hypothetical protein
LPSCLKTENMMGQAVGAKRSEVVQAGVFQTAGRGPPEQQHAVDTTSTTGSLVKIFKIQSAGRDSSEGMTAMDGHKQAGIQAAETAGCCLLFGLTGRLKQSRASAEVSHR